VASIFDGLNNLPIFEGVAQPDRRRALLEAGLAMTQPFDPMTGNNLTQITGGVSAGLASLDQSDRKNTFKEQQAFDNIIKGRGATAEESRAESAGVVADAAALNASTSEAAQGQTEVEFSAEKDLREAKVDLDKAQAEWLRRRFAGDPSGASKVTAAMIDQTVIMAQMENLYAADPGKYTTPDGKRNIALLTVQAFNDLHKAKGVADAEQLGFILDQGEGAAISGRISELQGTPPAPAAGVAGGDVPVITNAEEREKIPVGSDYMFNGQRFTKQ